VIQQAGLIERVRRRNDLGQFLATTNLVTQYLPVRLLARLMERGRERLFAAGAVIEGEDLDLFNIIRSGGIDRTTGSSVIDNLGVGDYFGEDSAILNVPTLAKLRAREDTVVLQLPGDMIADIPVVRWRIFENYQQRVARLLR
jgi:hemerythrin